jgi:hypothetical protein
MTDRRTDDWKGRKNVKKGCEEVFSIKYFTEIVKCGQNLFFLWEKTENFRYLRNGYLFKAPVRTTAVSYTTVEMFFQAIDRTYNMNLMNSDFCHETLTHVAFCSVKPTVQAVNLVFITF